MILRTVRWLIVLSLALIPVPTIVLNVGWTFKPQSPGWNRDYFAMERVQVTCLRHKNVLSRESTSGIRRGKLC